MGSLRKIYGADFLDWERLSLVFQTAGSVFGGSPSGFYSADTRFVDRGMQFINTGFSRFSAEVALHDTQPSALTFGFHFRIDKTFGPGGWNGNLDFFQLRYQDSPSGLATRHLAINISADRRLRFFKAGSGNNSGDMVYQTDPGFVEEGSWHYYEFQIKVTGPNNLRVWKDGSSNPVIAFTTAVVNGTTAATYSLAGFCWEQLGFNTFTFDNFYLRDDVDARYGIVRVTLHSIKDASDGDLFIGGWGVGGSLTLMPPWGGRLRELPGYPTIFTRPPDDDGSYMFTNTSGPQRAVFLFERYWSVGPVIGVCLNLIARSPGTDSYWEPIVRKFSFEYFGGESVVPTSATYLGFDKIYAVAPDTSLAWSEADLVAGSYSFGFKGRGGDNTLRVTQFVVQVLHRLAVSGTEYRIY